VELRFGWLFVFVLLSHQSAAVKFAIAMICQTPFAKVNASHLHDLHPISSMLHTIVPYAVRLPLAFFLGVSAIVRPVKEARLALRLHQSSFEKPFPVHCPSRSIWRKFSTTSDPKNVLCDCGKTYWVAAIASTSQLSPNPSRRVCTGVVSSGP
jgi:hypothetical protein